MQYKRKIIPSKVRAYIFERDEYSCNRCGATDRLAIDHIHPVSKGGTNDIENLQILCHACNSQKGNRPYQPLKQFNGPTFAEISVNRALAKRGHKVSEVWLLEHGFDVIDVERANAV